MSRPSTTLRHSILAALATLACQACHDGGAARVGPEVDEAARVDAEPEAPEAPGIALERSLHPTDITEVVVDPRASAALTLDRDGGVRLWTSLDGASAPLELPLDDPRALSLARRAEGGFVIAVLDTVGAAEVIAVESHASGFRLVSLFSIPPTDPLFELHVLDGGERLLALGVDHQIRRYDRDGRALAILAEHGFVPWQLRHVDTPEGVRAVAILAGPTRVQPLRITDDEIARVGEPIAIELDRGPNRNDLALTPDGARIAALTRPRRNQAPFTLKLTNLDDRSEVAIAGEVTRGVRPRLHLLADDRALLDDGSGVGLLVSTAASDGEPPAPSQRALPGTSDHMHVTVERGVRVAPDGCDLIVERLAGDTHLRIGPATATFQAGGLSPDGARVIWALQEGWAIETLTHEPGPTLQPTAIRPHQPMVFADFVDDERVILVSSTGLVELRRADSGVVLARAKTDGTLAAARLAPRSSDSPQPIVLVHGHAASDAAMFAIADTRLTELPAFEAHTHYVGPWYPEHTPTNWISQVATYPGWYARSAGEQTLENDVAAALELDHVDVTEVVARGDQRWLGVWADRPGALLVRARPGADPSKPYAEIESVTELEAGLGAVARLGPSPDGSLLAIVHEDRSLSMRDATTLQHLWTRADVHVASLAWSRDSGELLVVSVGRNRGGVLLVAETGAIELERRDFGLDVRTLATAALAPGPTAESDTTPDLR